MTANLSSSPREYAQPPRHQRQSPFRFGLWLILFGILLASCTSDTLRDPISIVQAAYDRLNEGDVDGFMKFLSDGAVLVDRSGRYAGSQTIRGYLEQDFVPEHVRIEISNLSANGNVVTYISKV